MRLDTVLLLMTLAAVLAAFIKARSSSLQWQAQLSRLETASGLPRIKDITKLEMASVGVWGTPAWTIWVPYGQSCKLRVATQQIDEPFPADYDEYHLLAGRHRVGITTRPSQPSLQLKLDGNEILQKEKNRTWNVAGNPETIVTDSVQANGDKPVVLFRRFARIRPSAEEEREMRKHRNGLLIWVQP